MTKNVSFYPSAAAAEQAGYRPCLRCRPETAPFSPAWNGTQATVTRALTMMEHGALDNETIEHFANRLGIGQRHLSRLFAKHIGASPTQTANTIRVQRAKRLLNSGALSIKQVAEKSGFNSVRALNGAFKKLYGRPPSTLSKNHLAEA